MLAVSAKRRYLADGAYRNFSLLQADEDSTTFATILYSLVGNQEKAALVSIPTPDESLIQLIGRQLARKDGMIMKAA